jgi:hypothetical protein
MAWDRVCPAILEPRVPARWFVQIATHGRFARVGVTELSPNSRRLVEKVGGINSSPYTFAVSIIRVASSWDTTRRSNLFLSSRGLVTRPSTIFAPQGPASSFTMAIGKCLRLVVGFRMPPR